MNPFCWQIALLLSCLNIRPTIGDCYKAGKQFVNPNFGNETVYVMDGVNGTCVMAVTEKLNYSRAKDSCVEKLSNGRLMTVENYNATAKGWQKYNFSDTNQHWYVDFPLGVGESCMTIWVNSTATTKQQWNKSDCDKGRYLCQYPFQYNCASDRRASEQLVLKNNKLYFKFETQWWQNSDYDHAKDCRPTPPTEIETISLLQECKEPRFEKIWLQLSNCSAPCTHPGREPPVERWYKRIVSKCTAQHASLNNVVLLGNRTCNTHIPCPGVILGAESTPSISAESTPSISAESTPSISAESTPSISAESTPSSSRVGEKTEAPADYFPIMGAVIGVIVLSAIVLSASVYFLSKIKKKSSGSKAATFKSVRDKSEKSDKRRKSWKPDKRDKPYESDKQGKTNKSEKEGKSDNRSKKKKAFLSPFPKDKSEKEGKDTTCTTSVCADLSMAGGVILKKDKKTDTKKAYVTMAPVGKVSEAKMAGGKTAAVPESTAASDNESAPLSLPALSKNADIFTLVKPKPNKKTVSEKSEEKSKKKADRKK